MNWFGNWFGGGNQKKTNEQKTPKTSQTKRTATAKPPVKTSAKATTKAPAKAPASKAQASKQKEGTKTKAKDVTKKTLKEDKTPPVKKEEKPKDRKTKSVESVFNSTKPISVDKFGSRLSSMNGSPPGQTIFDVSAYIIHCPEHNNIAISVDEKRNYVWLPFVSLPSARTWSDGALDGANIVLSEGTPMHIWL